jgi:hypothetical protein
MQLLWHNLGPRSVSTHCNYSNAWCCGNRTYHFLQLLPSEANGRRTQFQEDVTSTILLFTCTFKTSVVELSDRLLDPPGHGTPLGWTFYEVVLVVSTVLGRSPENTNWCTTAPTPPIRATIQMPITRGDGNSKPVIKTAIKLAKV